MDPLHGPRRFAIALEPEFSFNSFALLTEVLRIANQNTGLNLVASRVVAAERQPVRGSNGMWVDVDLTLSEIADIDVVIVVGGNLPTQVLNPKLLNPLRRLARYGTLIGATNAGTFALARASLLDGHAFTTHWETRSTFVEYFPDLEPSSAIYVRDRDRFTCAGGTAIIDVMLDILSDYFGPELSTEIANGLVHHIRPPETPQLNRDRRPNPQSLTRRIVQLMEANIENPLSTGDLAKRLGMNRRTLERKCVAECGQTLARLYLKIRLQAARNLLFYDDRPVSEIALICGFAYASVFSRAFKKQFSVPPQKFRSKLRLQQGKSMRPELFRQLS